MIDSIPQEKLNLTKKLSLGNTMYVGGVPEKNVQLPDSLVGYYQTLHLELIYCILNNFFCFTECSSIQRVHAGFCCKPSRRRTDK